MARRVWLEQCVLLTALISSVGGAASLHVPSDYTTITAAVDAANPGDVVEVGPGVYRESVVLGSNIILSGAGADSTVIEAVDSHAVLADQVRASTIRGFTLRGAGSYAVMIQRGSFVHVLDNVITESGGGIEFYESTGSVVGNTFIDFSDEDQYAVSCMNDSSPLITRNFIIRSDYGVMSYYESHPTITNNTIVGGRVGIEMRDFFDIKTSKPVILNNIITEHAVGIRSLNGAEPRDMGYTLFWDNEQNYEDLSPAETDIEADPQFVDPDNDNFHLTAGSRAIDTGTPVEHDDQQTIYDGNGDGMSTIDLGAAEYDLEHPSTGGGAPSASADQSWTADADHTSSLNRAGGCRSVPHHAAYLWLSFLLHIGYRLARRRQPQH